MKDQGDPFSAFRAPPANLQAERALLGALMMNNKAYDRIEGLSADDFADTANIAVFTAIAALCEGGRQANPVTLATYLEHDEAVKAAGGIKYLTALSGSVVTMINVADYAQQIRDLATRRRMIQFGSDIAFAAAEVTVETSGADLIDRAEGALMAMAGATPAKGVGLGAAAGLALADWERADTDQGVGLPLGLPSVEGIIGKPRAGDFLIVAGNTGMGKSSLATTIAMNAARAGKRGVFFSLEMPVDQLASRILTNETGILGPRQRSWPLAEGDWDRLHTAHAGLNGLPLILQYMPGLTLPALRSALRRYARRGLDYAIVDYLQIMGRAPGARFEGRVQEISELTRNLKATAGEIGIPIFCLSQLSRENWKRENPRPMLSDLRDSGSIEQDSDVVMFVYRHEYFLANREPEQKPEEGEEKFGERYRKWQTNTDEAAGKAEIIVAKNRHGPPGTAKLRFDAAKALFYEG